MDPDGHGYCDECLRGFHENCYDVKCKCKQEAHGKNGHYQGCECEFCINADYRKV